jgi:hypothetical protein
MKFRLHRYLNALVLSASLLAASGAVAQDRDHDAQVKRYEDRAHKDSHEWNEAEDHAYRKYLEEHHRKYHEFDKANRKEQDDYWKWRHLHPDDHR